MEANRLVEPHLSQRDRLSIKVDRRSAYAVAVLAGTIDFATHERLAGELARAMTPGTAAVIVDLSAVPFCDSSGLNVFARAYRAAQARGMTLVLTGLRDRVARVFSITGLDRRICVRPDPDSALHWLETGRHDAAG